MPSVFICHRKPDAKLAEKLASHIKNQGNQVWFDEWQIDIGDSIVEKIDKGLENTTYLVLCYSSVGQSDWTTREWQSTLARQLSGYNVKILPVLLSGKDIPAILADIKYADLVSNWEQGIKQLLEAIR